MQLSSVGLLVFMEYCIILKAYAYKGQSCINSFGIHCEIFNHDGLICYKCGYNMLFLHCHLVIKEPVIISITAQMCIKLQCFAPW